MDEAKGKVFAFADPNSTSGYLVPGAELAAKYGTLENYFSEVKMSGGHEQTIVGVANGDFDAGVSWADGLGNWEDGFTSGAFRKAADAGLVDMNDIKEIWRSKLIPEGPMVLRRTLPQDVKDKMTAMLDTMWAFMQMGGLKADYPALKEACMELRQMMMQKTAGQRKDKPKDLSWDNLERVKVTIICEAMALVLSGEYEEAGA